MDRITFLLGAGASYKSIPTYANFTSGFSNFVGEIQTFITKKIRSDASIHSGASDLVISTLKEIQSNIVNGSPDLYANKLNSRTDVHSKKKLKELKVLISLYLLFEQLPKDEDLYRSEFEMKNEINLDNRYEYFLGSVLDDNGMLVPNVNILSWNYDMQVEIAYCERTGLSLYEAISNLNLLSGQARSRFNDAYRMVKLNGTAGLFVENSWEQQMSYLVDFPGAKFDYNTLLLFFNYLTELVNPDNRMSGSQLNPQIFFAWEKNQHSNYVRKTAKDIMTNTDILVVIGYSFHPFNAPVDKEMLAGATDLSKIYLQVAPKDFKAVKDRIIRLLPKNEDIEIIQTGEDLELFYIPSEFYG